MFNLAALEPRWYQPMDYWRFICNSGTRPECFRRQLVGAEEERAVRPGDTIILYDYSENRIYGPMRALTECQRDINPDAWRGEYPYQVRVTWEALYRISSSECPQIESTDALSEDEYAQIVERLQTEGRRLLLPDWGSPVAALADDLLVEPDEAEITAARTELEAALDDPPPEPSDVTRASEPQIVREAAFRRTVRDAYDRSCALCGSRRETPSGQPEVEAAHLLPKAQGGPDDIRNGIALCKLHHWAFDSGWFTIGPDYEVSVCAAPGRHGYDEFNRFDGSRITLPVDQRKHPARKYLK